jgi:small subunit ribosomal protein S1
MKEAQEIDIQRLYEAYSPPRVQNQIVKGRVVAVDENEVLVSIGHKAEGRIPLSEWHHDEPKPQVGDEVEVYVESLQTREGTAKLSRRLAHSLRTWQIIQEALEKDIPIEGVIRRRTKGGFVVDIDGIEAFLPGSQVDVRPSSSLGQLRGALGPPYAIQSRQNQSRSAQCRRLPQSPH